MSLWTAGAEGTVCVLCGGAETQQGIPAQQPEAIKPAEDGP